MNEPQLSGRRSRGRAKKQKPEQGSDPLTRAEPAEGGNDALVELDAAGEQAIARQETRPDERVELRERGDFDEDDRLVEWESGYDEDIELEPDYDEEEAEFDSDYDEEPEFEADYAEEPDVGPRRPAGPEPRLAPGPKPGPGHPPEHGPGPKKVPWKKAPGKKAAAKKAPAKKAPGPKKHPGHPPPPPHEHGPGHPPPPPHEHGPGHPPPPPHEHGPGHGPGETGPESDFGLGPGTDLGFGPVPGFDFGSGLGPNPRGRRRRSGPGRRGRPGDVRAAILSLLTERPMHGYEMIEEIADRSQDLWRPSPGSVYPALQLLGEEGLIVGSEGQGNQKLFELTDEGHAAAKKINTPPWEKIAGGVDSSQVKLRAELAQLVGAVAQSAYATTAEQQQRIIAILRKARREIYTMLAELLAEPD